MNNCKWTLINDADHEWETECRKSIELFYDGPYDNDYIYCPYCSGQIIEDRSLFNEVKDEA